MIRTEEQPCQQGGNKDGLLVVSESPFGRQVSSSALLGTGDALKIHHQNEVYTLRRTRAGKLILTK